MSPFMLVALSALSTVYSQTVSTQPSTIPPFPTTYSTLVAVNNDLYGYTNAYTENYNSTLNQLYTAGRYDSNNIVELYDINANVLVQYNSSLYDGISATGAYYTGCTTYDATATNSQFSASNIYNATLAVSTLPVAQLTTTLPIAMVGSYVSPHSTDYAPVGITTDARGISCYTYTATYNITQLQQIYNFTYYVAAGTTVAGLANLDPVRLQMTVTNYTTVSTTNSSTNMTTQSTTVYHQTYDFVQFAHSISDTTGFQLYAQTGSNKCAASTATTLGSYRSALPTQSTIQLTNTAVTAPTLPNQFSSVLEVKLNGTALGSRVSTVNWILDAVQNKQRVQYMTVTTQNVNDPITAIYDDTLQYVYQYDPINGCVFTASSSDNASPIQVFRAGSIAAIFKNSSTMLLNATYVGRIPARGVSADVWRLQNQTRVNNGDTFYYTMDIYYFPQGWNFIGRPQSTLSQMPMRINNYGYYSSNLQANIQYNDVWDFYSLYAQPQNAQLFNQTTLPCNTVQSTSILPALPTHYSTVVSANINNKGYTLAYTEYYDSTLGLLRNDGKFQQSNMIEVIDYVAGTDMLFPQTGTATDATAACTLSAYSANTLSQPSIYFFTLFNVSAVQYQGNSTAARGILCDVWQGSSTRFNSSITILYYFAIATQYIGRVPVRVSVQGTGMTRSGTPYIINHIYDWINFVSGAQDPSLFTRPSVDSCVAGTGSNALTLPQASTVTAVNPSNPPALPTIANEWSAVLETKLNSATSTISTVKWYFDQADDQERIDLVTAGSNNYMTYLYYYNNPMANSGDSYVITNGQCTGSTQVPYITTINPLAQIRAGSIPNLLWNASTALYNNNAIQYNGRSTDARGITCDVYQLNNLTRTNYGITYYYSTQLYFFAQGWQFPGRPSTSRLPARIINTGTYTDSTGTVQTYSDMFDLFDFITGEADWMFTLSNYNCPDLHPPATLSEQTIAMGALMGVLLGVIIIGGGSYLCLQRIKAKKESEDAMMRIAAAQDDDSDDDTDQEYNNDSYVTADTGSTVDYASPSPEPNTTFEGVKNNDKESLV